MPTVNDVSELFGITKQTARDWAGKYAKHLSPGANPGKGKAREFTEQDLRVLALVNQMRAKHTTNDIMAALGAGQLGELPTAPEAAEEPKPEATAGPGTQLRERDLFERLEVFRQSAIAPYRERIEDLEQVRDYWQGKAEEREQALETERQAHADTRDKATRLETKLQVYKDLAQQEQPAEGQIGATEGQIEPTETSRGLIAWLRRRLSSD